MGNRRQKRIMVAAATLTVGSLGVLLSPAQKAVSIPKTHQWSPGVGGSRRHLSQSINIVTCRAAAKTSIDSSEQLGKEESTSGGGGGGKYHFVVANAKFMLDEEEHFKELLFERLRNYGERSKERDFWLIVEPKFLSKFPQISSRLKRPAVALVSTNAAWITYMKLRLDRVLAESYEADSLEEALASDPANLEFDKPEKWVAPYPKYEYGWWEPFLPPNPHQV